jgi:cation diffusion facilitator CzcD-associated flavoprotein CzcO
MATQHYDAIVIGAGQAGVPLATTLAKALTAAPLTTALATGR